MPNFVLELQHKNKLSPNQTENTYMLYEYKVTREVCMQVCVSGVAPCLVLLCALVSWAVHVRACERVSVWACERVYACACLWVLARVRTCMTVYVCMCVSVSLCVRVCLLAYVQMQGPEQELTRFSRSLKNQQFHPSMSFWGRSSPGWRSCNIGITGGCLFWR